MQTTFMSRMRDDDPGTSLINEMLPAAARVSCFCLLFAGGCSSTPETLRPSLPPETRTQPPPPQMEFETRTDTVRALKSKEGEPSGLRNSERQIRYMVQIGAFRNPHNASKVQLSARERYHMPVLNDFDVALGLYQIRIGFFESEDAAQAFCNRLQKEYTAEYKDSWVVHLIR